jgi:hypothetical protein
MSCQTPDTSRINVVRPCKKNEPDSRGLVPGIHAERRLSTSEGFCGGAAWMTGTSPVMTP